MIWNNTFAYKLVLLLHLASVVVGYGPYVFNGLLAKLASTESADGSRALNAASLQVSTLSQYAIYGVPIFGIGLINLSNHAITFSQGWVPAAIVVWIGTVGVLHGLILPTQRKLKAGGGDGRALAKTLSTGFGVMNLLVVVALVLMVFEPGSHL